MRWRQPEADLWPLGQDAVLAAPLARRFRTLFQEGAALHDCAEWLKDLDYRDAGDKGGEFAKTAD